MKQLYFLFALVLSSISLDSFAQQTKPFQIFFATGSSAPNAGDLARVDSLIAEQKNSEIRYFIEGHTDNTGDESINRNLSIARAESIAGYLFSKGIPAARIRSNGFGFASPLGDNNTEKGRSLNRRVDIRLEKPATEPKKEIIQPQEKEIQQTVETVDELESPQVAVPLPHIQERDTLISFPSGAQLAVAGGSFQPFCATRNVNYTLDRVALPCDFIRAGFDGLTTDGQCLFLTGIFKASLQYQGNPVKPQTSQKPQLLLRPSQPFPTGVFNVYIPVSSGNSSTQKWQLLSSGHSLDKDGQLTLALPDAPVFAIGMPRGGDCALSPTLKVKIPRLKQADVLIYYADEPVAFRAMPTEKNRIYTIPSRDLEYEPGIAIASRKSKKKGRVATVSMHKARFNKRKNQYTITRWFTFKVKVPPGEGNIDVMCKVLEIEWDLRRRGMK
jgi:hypothetical protein